MSLSTHRSRCRKSPPLRARKNGKSTTVTSRSKPCTFDSRAHEVALHVYRKSPTLKFSHASKKKHPQQRPMKKSSYPSCEKKPHSLKKSYIYNKHAQRISREKTRKATTTTTTIRGAAAADKARVYVQERERETRGPPSNNASKQCTQGGRRRRRAGARYNVDNRQICARRRRVRWRRGQRTRRRREEQLRPRGATRRKGR